MSNFETALKVLLHHEGGYANRVNDRGGPTNFGITLATLTEYQGRPATMEQIQALTADKAAQIYQRLFWDRMALDHVESELVATVLLDQGVLTGPGTAVGRLQTLLGLHPDGLPGPLTTVAINRENGEALAFRFIRASSHHYTAVVAADPTQLEFFAGWSDRLYSLLDFVFLGDFT